MIQTGWFKANDPAGNGLEILLRYDDGDLDTFIEIVAKAELEADIKVILDDDGRRLVEAEKEKLTR